MHSIAGELEKTIHHYFPALSSLDEDEAAIKPSPVKWSKKEIIGHLADSAQNNLRRFIVAQYENEPYIVYDQDKWVAISNYQQYDVPALVTLWYLLNKQIVHILRNTPHEMSQRTCRSQEVHTIEWLAADYIKHMRHHLHQVLNLEAVEYP
jgi:hypothetical protein